jgi:uncharacterized membrane-anchored protein
MGLREATFFTVILGMAAAATADAKPARSEPAKTAKPAADPKAAERPDPGAATDATTKPGAGSGEPAAAEDTAPRHVVGPKHVELGGAASIDLPAGYWLFERAEAQELARKMGNSPDSVVATIVNPEADWLIVIHYHDDGYIDDSDAGDLDASELLDAIRKGTAEQNEKRKAQGVPELLIDGWTEPPRYERAQHHLVWGIAGHTTRGKVINFLTRILGRNGFVSVNLIDEPERIEASKKDALAILHATRFNPGSTYADHVSSDHSSGIGLRGLVLGGAGVAVASKLGLLAKVLLLFKKLFIVIGAAIAGLFRWLFRRKPAASSDPMSMGPPSDPPPAGPAST